MKFYWINQSQNYDDGVQLAQEIETVDLATIRQNYLFNAGVSANICYTESDFNQIAAKDYNKTIQRATSAQAHGHHSIFGHQHVSFYIVGIPKALAMVINNEKEYNTSEKSGRYTVMREDDESNKFYNKWASIFTDLITDEYQQRYPKYFTDTKIRNLARENARYMLSIYTPASMQYTTSYRQLNYLYGFFQKEINNPDTNEFYRPLVPFMQEFCDTIEPLILPDLVDTQKNRSLTLVNNNSYSMEQYYGDVYCTRYKASLVAYAQLARHRSIDYNFKLLKNQQYYVPPILQNRAGLAEEWLEDCASQAPKLPQCTLVDTTERGTYETFLAKLKERQCSHAQLEANKITTDILNRYHKSMTNNNHPRAKEMEQYTRGARCTFPDYTCTDPCHFPEGIAMQRKI